MEKSSLLVNKPVFLAFLSIILVACQEAKVIREDLKVGRGLTQKADEELISELMASLQKNESQAVTIQRITELRGRAAPLLPALIGLLDSPSVVTRRYALRALACVGPSACSALPRLSRLVDEEKPGDYPLVVTTTMSNFVATNPGRIVLYSSEAIRTIGCLGSEAIPYLSRLIRDKRDWVRLNALSVVDDRRLYDSPMIPILEALREDDDHELVRYYARLLLRRIRD